MRTPPGLAPARRGILLASLRVLALLPWSLSAQAIECGEVLVEDTVLEADLTCPGDGLVVGADGITIDLGGHALRGPLVELAPDLPASSFGIRNAGYARVEIRNGTVDGFERGVELVGATRNRIEALSTAVVECRTECAAIVLIDSDRNRVRGNEVTAFGVDGISLIDSHRNRIEDNRATGSEVEQGISLLRSDRNRLIDNSVEFHSSGIVLEESDHNILERNTSSINFGNAIGLFASDHNRVIGNSAGGSDGSGIALFDSHRNRVAGNDIPGGEFDGLVLRSSDKNRIESNLVYDHVDRGIRIVSGAKNDLVRNVVLRSGLDGILIEAGSRETRVHRGITADNGDDGLDVEDPTARVVRHLATGNADLGIEAVPGVRGSRNRASGNGNLEQCTNLHCQ